MENDSKSYIPSLIIILVLIFCMALPACTRGRTTGNERRYDLKGRVVSLDKAEYKVVIAHEDIPGLMDAMTMPFMLKDDWTFDVMNVGDDIQATLVVDGDRSWLENPVISRSNPKQNGVTVPGNSTEPLPGKEVPDFSLTNQNGKRIHLQQYRGRALLVTFIYTRCPLPEYCPLMSTNFAWLDRELQGNTELQGKTHLLSVSIDPTYDTPKIIRDYGAAQTGKYEQETFHHWEFATGEPEEIRRIAEFFGLTYSKESDQIIHSLRTALIAPDGRIFKIYRGNEWKPAEVLRDMQKTVVSSQ